MQIKVKTPAKINLTLEITGKRPDGFHNIRSVMQMINLYDILTINIKHGKNTESIEKEIYELQIMLRTLEQTKGMLVDDLSENDVEIKDIIEYCEE